MVVRYELKRKTNTVSCLANLFYSVGDFKNCESLYVKYIKIFENNIGKNTLDTSNCYFLVGVFYLKEVCLTIYHLYFKKYFAKALACFRHCIKIRTDILSPVHESISDCYYNIGIIYKNLRKFHKAT